MKKLQSITSLQQKYTYKPYQKNFPELYEAEKTRISNGLTNIKCDIYHFGSTAIPGVGGKGIIDIIISTDYKNLVEITNRLINLGYEFREGGGNENRRFHQTEIQGRRYHVHVTNFNNPELIEAIAFRDYLIENPKLAQEYSEVKKFASEIALQQTTREGMKTAYALAKKPVIDKIFEKLPEYIARRKYKKL